MFCVSARASAPAMDAHWLRCNLWDSQWNCAKWKQIFTFTPRNAIKVVRFPWWVASCALEAGAINALRINVDNTLMAIFTMHAEALARFLRGGQKNCHFECFAVAAFKAHGMECVSVNAHFQRRQWIRIYFHCNSNAIHPIYWRDWISMNLLPSLRPALSLSPSRYRATWTRWPCLLS